MFNHLHLGAKYKLMNKFVEKFKIDFNIIEILDEIESPEANLKELEMKLSLKSSYDLFKILANEMLPEIDEQVEYIDAYNLSRKLSNQPTVTYPPNSHFERSDLFVIKNQVNEHLNWLEYYFNDIHYDTIKIMIKEIQDLNES